MEIDSDNLDAGEVVVTDGTQEYCEKIVEQLGEQGVKAFIVYKTKQGRHGPCSYCSVVVDRDLQCVAAIAMRNVRDKEQKNVRKYDDQFRSEIFVIMLRAGAIAAVAYLLIREISVAIMVGICGSLLWTFVKAMFGSEE